MPKNKLQEFLDKNKGICNDKEAAELQHKKGKLTARERLKYLLDEGSFIELDAFAELQSKDLESRKKGGDGVVTGYGTISKRPVYVYAQDFSFMGGSMGEMHNRKIANVMELALKTGCPCIGLLDSGGARIQEGVSALDSGGRIFQLNTSSSGIIPQISAVLGPCAGIAVYSPALTDFIFMVRKTGYMFITGPDVIKAVTGEVIDFEGLGGAAPHSQKSGVAHFTADSEKECIDMIKVLLSYLPQNNLESPPYISPSDSPLRETGRLENIVPEDAKKTYDIKDVIAEIFDKKSFFEIHAGFAENVVTGFARHNGHVVGVVANQPKVLAGCLDINSSDKIARFVRFCDCFNIPLINIVDVTGYLPGTEQEHNGIIRHGAKILYSYSEATVPKISLVLRKAYGGAYIALVSKDMGFDKVLVWPTAEIAVMGADQAVSIINKDELSKNAEKVRANLVNQYAERYLNPYVAAKLGKVDIIVEPKNTRNALIRCLEMMLTKREKKPAKKHGNMPL